MHPPCCDLRLTDVNIIFLYLSLSAYVHFDLLTHLTTFLNVWPLCAVNRLTFLNVRPLCAVNRLLSLACLPSLSCWGIADQETLLCPPPQSHQLPTAAYPGPPASFRRIRSEPNQGADSPQHPGKLTLRLCGLCLCESLSIRLGSCLKTGQHSIKFFCNYKEN